MPFATLDGIKTHFMTAGTGPHLLMLAPRGFNSSIEGWNMNKWKDLDVFAALSKHFTCVAYDRREAGQSGGRVETITYDIMARQGKLLLEHLGVEKAWVAGACMGVSVATKYAALYPEGCSGLLLLQPVGGYRWMSKMRSLFDAHTIYVLEHGLQGVVDYAKEARKPFQEDGTAGPWASVMLHDEAFVARFLEQDEATYLSIVAASRDALYDDTFVCGATPQELVATNVPAFCWAGDDQMHTTSAAHQLRELMPKIRFWDQHTSKHTAQNHQEQVLKFKQDVESGAFSGKG